MLSFSFFFLLPFVLFSAGELSTEEIEALVAVLQNPRQFNIPEWFLNRRKDARTGKTEQVHANGLIAKLREDLETLKKIR